MSAAGALVAALAERLSADPAVAGRVHGVEVDRRDPSGALPALTLAGLATVDWSTKTDAGAEVQLQLTVHARAEDAAAARAALDAARAALAMPPPVPGWQLVSWTERGSAWGSAKGAQAPVRLSADWRARLLRLAG